MSDFLEDALKGVSSEAEAATSWRDHAVRMDESKPVPSWRDHAVRITPQSPDVQQGPQIPADVSPMQARSALGLSSKADYTAPFVLDNQKEVQSEWLRDRLAPRLTGLPRLAEYANQSPVHTTAIADDVDNLGVIDWALGKGHYVPFPGNTPEERAANVVGPGRYVEDVPPGWLLSYGQMVYSRLGALQTSFESHFREGGPDLERIKRDREAEQVQLPGAHAPLGRILYGAQGLVQTVAPYTLNPALTFGLMYAEGQGRVYEDLRLHGYSDEEAMDVSELTGFTSASVGAMLGGPLFGSLLPKSWIGVIGESVPSALLSAVSERPAFWKFMLDLGKNQVHATLMNVGMSLSETAIMEGFDSYKNGRSFNPSILLETLKKSTAGSLELLPLSAFAATRGELQRARLWSEGGPLREMNRYQARSMEEEQALMDTYERQGHALNSMKQAADLLAAAEAVRRSKFMQEQPEEGQKLLQSILKPRKSQTVFVDPEVVKNLPQADLDHLGVERMTDALQSGALTQMRLDRALTAPSADQILQNSAAEADGPTAKEAERDWEAWANEEQPPPGAARGVPRPPGPTLGYQGPLKRASLDRWAKDRVESQPLGVLDSLARAHASNARVAATNKENEQMRSTEILARAAGKAQAGVGAGVASGETGRMGIDIATERPPTLSQLIAQKEMLLKEPASPERQVKLNRLMDQMRAAGERTYQERVLDEQTSNRLLAQEARRISSGEGKQAETKGVAATAEEIKAGEAQIRSKRWERVQAVNEAMTRALTDAKEERDSVRATVKERSSGRTRAEMYRAGEDYGTAHDALVEALGADKHGYAAPDVSDVAIQMRADGFDPTFDEDMLNKFLDNPRPLDELSLPEAREIKKALEQIGEAAKAQNELRAKEWQGDMEMARDQVLRSLANVPLMPPGQRAWLDSSDALTPWQRFTGFLAGVRGNMHQPYTIFAKMGKIGDSLWFDGFVGSRNREERMHEDIMPEVQDIVDKMPGDLTGSAKDVIKPLFGAPAKWGLRTRSDMWRLMLHLGNESGREKIARGLNVSVPVLLDWVQSNLGRTPEQAQTVMDTVIQPMWKVFDRMWDKYYPDYFRERGLAPPERVVAAPVRVGDKTYTGGYGGRLRWANLDRIYDPVDPESMAALLGLDGQAPSTNTGSTKERTQVSGIPHTDWMSVPGSIRSEIHDLAMHGFVENTLKLLKDPLIRDTLSDKIGKQLVDELYNPNDQTSWLHVVAQGKIPDIASAGYITRIVSNLQGRAALSAFSLNSRVLLQQFSHIPAMSFGLGIRPDFMAAGMTAAFNAEKRVAARSMSQVLDYRWNDFERHNVDLLRSITGVQPGQDVVRRNIDHFNWAIWQQMDGFLSHAIWEAARLQARSDGKSHPESILEADKAVQRGMPVQSIYEQSAFVRNRSALGMLFLVRNFPNTLYNVAALNSWSARVNSQSLLARYGRNAGAGALNLGMVLSAEVFGRWMAGHGPRENDPKANVEAWLARRVPAAIAYPFQLGEVAEGAVAALQGDTQGVKSAMDRMKPPAISAAGQALIGLSNGVSKDDQESIQAFLTVLGIAAKAPLPRFWDWITAPFEDSPGAALQHGMGYRP